MATKNSKEEKENKKMLLLIGGAVAVTALAGYLIFKKDKKSVPIGSKGKICFSTAPASAQVNVFGQTLTTPQCIDLFPGNYEYIISLSGYENIEGTANVFLGQTTNITRTLVPIATGELCYTTDNDPATVWVEHVGTFQTPFCETIPKGTHLTVLTKPGYETISQYGVITEGQTLNMFNNLTPAGANGTWQADANECCPVAPLMSVDFEILGTGIGGVTPTSKSLTPGTYVAVGTKAGHQSQRLALTITSGAILVRNFLLDKIIGQQGDLDIDHNPSPIEVLNNVNYDDGGGEQFLGNSPGLFSLPVGVYDISIDDTNLPPRCFSKEVQEGIVVNDGSSQTIDFNLSFFPDEFSIDFISTDITSLEGSDFPISARIRRDKGCLDTALLAFGELRDRTTGQVVADTGSPRPMVWNLGTLSPTLLDTGTMNMQGIAPAGYYDVHIVLKDGSGAIVWEQQAGTHLVIRPLPPPPGCQLQDFADFDAGHTGVVRWRCQDTYCVQQFCQQDATVLALDVDYSNPLSAGDSYSATIPPLTPALCQDSIESWINYGFDIEYIWCDVTNTYWVVLFPATIIRTP